MKKYFKAIVYGFLFSFCLFINVRQHVLDKPMYFTLFIAAVFFLVCCIRSYNLAKISRLPSSTQWLSLRSRRPTANEIAIDLLLEAPEELHWFPEPAPMFNQDYLHFLHSYENDLRNEITPLIVPSPHYNFINTDQCDQHDLLLVDYLTLIDDLINQVIHVHEEHQGFALRHAPTLRGQIRDSRLWLEFTKKTLLEDRLTAQEAPVVDDVLPPGFTNKLPSGYVYDLRGKPGKFIRSKEKGERVSVSQQTQLMGE